MNKPLSHCYDVDDEITTVINMCIQDDTDINALCLTEIPENETMNVLNEYHDYCDIVCCVFDVTNPATFGWVQEKIALLKNGTKILLIGTKADLLSKV